MIIKRTIKMIYFVLYVVSLPNLIPSLIIKQIMVKFEGFMLY